MPLAAAAAAAAAVLLASAAGATEEVQAVLNAALPPEPAQAAMHVELRGSRFYGGLELLHHPLLATQVCRLYNACIRPDGAVLLPKWMARHDLALERSCGVVARFELPDSDPPPGGPLQPYDLFGVRVPRQHMPAFFADFLPNAISLDTVLGERQLTRNCYTRAGKKCDALPPLDKGELRPAVFMDTRALEVQEKDSWVRQIVRMATSGSEVEKTKLLLWPNVFRNVEAENVKCFRSAYVSRAPKTRMQIKPGLFDTLRLFVNNSVEKKAALVRRETDNKCLLNVMFVNRKPVENNPDRLVGRYIPNIPDIRTELHKLAEEAGDITLFVDAVRLEGRSLKWQMNAMQKAHVLVGGHSAMLANMVFMRSWSSVLEIQPFAYYPDDYERLATRIANLRYDAYIARPDKIAFDACMAHFYPEGADHYKEAMAAQRRYHKAVENYEKSDKNTHSVTLHNLDESLANVRVCAEMQNLEAPPVRLAERIFSLVKSTCNRKLT